MRLALCWTIAMYNSQGQTAKNAVMALRKSGATIGPTFACLSRAKRLVDLLTEFIPFDRLSKLGKSLL